MTRKAFEKIMQGLLEAREYARGGKVKGLRVHKRKVVRNEVASLRIRIGLTQSEFAKLVGASLGTVRKWETGERKPSGAAGRLLQLLDAKPTVVTQVLGVRPKAPKRTPRSQLVAAE